MSRRVIAVDFDGTCVTHEYPKVGRDIGAGPVLVELQVKYPETVLILLTMRSGGELEEAIDWFKRWGITLWAVNENPEQKSWTESPKVYAHLYIDDAALGAPLCDGLSGERPFLDWKKAAVFLGLEL